MLPFLALPLWETDATMRAAIQQGVQASLTSLGSGAVTAGGEVTLDARAASRRAVYLALLHADYAHVFDVTVTSGAGSPSYNLDADTALSAEWTPSPRSSLSLQTEGSLATTLGVPADTQLLALDPFLAGQRLEYALGHTLTWTLETTPRDGLTLECGYLQSGALAAEKVSFPIDPRSGLRTGQPTRHASVPTTGVDTHEVHAALSPDHEIGARDSIAPELRYAYTHYAHALLGADLASGRGPADVHTITFSASGSHEIARSMSAGATVGVSVGSPMPWVHDGHPVVAPDAGVSLRWTGKQERLTARAAYGYTSLGPLLGHGQQAKATLRLDVRPWEGARYRDFLLHGALRFAHGAAPLGADPQPALPGMPVLPPSASLTTTTLAARLRADIPLRRGLSLTAGSDLAFVRGVIDAPPPGGGVSRQVRITLTFGLAGTLSTDRARTTPRDPTGGPEDEDHRAAPAAEGDDRGGQEDGP
jgi:hypothetical protein